MCGVFAALLNRGSLCHDRVHRALQSLVHRGPDGEGIWLSDDHRVALGHRRLSVIGLKNGVQPIANENETIRVTVNGEFYDFESIRRDLQQRGHHFRTQSDSEIVLHLYEEHGLDCLHFLRGEFSFILWDAARARLIAARDRFGVKPLCYAHNSAGIMLASEAKALFAAGLRPAWDRESFFHASAMQYVLPDRTFFEGVRQLPPGHVLVAESPGACSSGFVGLARSAGCTEPRDSAPPRSVNVTTRPFWDLCFPPLTANDSLESTSTVDNTARQSIERCRHHVIEAIRTRLRSDVPVCCQLSGGLDSGTVLSVACELSSQPLDAFVISFDASEYDERALADETARSCGARLHVVPVSQIQLLENLGQAVAHSEGLAINGHLPAKFLLHRAIHDRGFKVVLTGEGADEVFGGYAHLCLDQWCFLGQTDQHRSQRLVRSNRTSLGMMLPQGPGLSLAAIQARLGYAPTYLRAKASLGWRVHSLLRDEVLAEFRGRDAYRELIDSTAAVRHLRGRHPVNQSTWLWSKTALAGYILKTLGDGTEMASSVEGRVPLLDHRLFEQIRNLPVSLKIRNSTPKYIFREAVRPLVNNDLYRREKHPLDAPPLSLFRSSKANALLHARLRDSSFRRQPFFCPDKCTKLLDGFSQHDQHERQAWDPALMMVLSTVCMQQFLETNNQCMN